MDGTKRARLQDLSLLVFDANGNMLTGSGRSITWNSFNKPAKISGPRGSSLLKYGSELQLVQSIETGEGGDNTTTYVNPVFEVVSRSTGTEFRHNFMAGGLAGWRVAGWPGSSPPVA